MNETARFFKLFSDQTRLRVLMLITRQELCVCQIMGVLGVSQPLVSRNLSLLSGAGLVDERKDGKLIFYSLRKRLSGLSGGVIRQLKAEMKDNTRFQDDLASLGECHEFQRKSGKCDMKTFLKYMQQRRKKSRSKTRKTR